MSLIYSCLSNPAGDLDEVKNEFADLLNFFNDPKNQSKTRFQFALNGTIQDITSYLAEHQSELRLFHFSGHSGHSGLDFEGEDFDVEHVSKFFNTLTASKHLQCVFLNGCENEDIVERLNSVPVVIGTRSKIQDNVARKVTLDFFKALIGGESTYENAFSIALQASHIPDAHVTTTRSEGSRLAGDKDKAINQYFIQYNDQDIANRQYAFSPKQKNWTKYLLFFLLFLVVGLGFIFKNDIFKKTLGYDCTIINKEPNKCNFVIANFTAPSTVIDDPSIWLFENIKTAPKIRQYLHPIHLGSFEKVIRGSSLDPDSLPARCDYDFNLTGSIQATTTGLNAEFNIFPFNTGEPSYKVVHYPVATLDMLDSIITRLSPDNGNAFILYEMCIACAMKRNFPSLPNALQSLADEYDPTHSTETYQRFMNDLATVQLRYADSESAIQVLDKAVKASGNDFALMAIERKIDIYDQKKYFLRSIDTHTELIAQLQSRIRNPNVYKLSREVKAYQSGQDKVRFNRAMMIFNHRDEINDSYKQLAIADFTYLMSIQYPPGDFSKEIAILNGESSTSADHDMRLQGRVFNEKGQPLQNAEVRFAIRVKTTDANGRFDFGSFNMVELNGQSLLVSKAGYAYARVPITQKNISKIVLQPESILISVSGQVVDVNQRPIEGAFISAMDKTTKTNSKGEFSFGQYAVKDVQGQFLNVSLSGYEDKKVSISRENLDQIILTAIANDTYTIIVHAFSVENTRYKKIMTALRTNQFPFDPSRSMNYDSIPSSSERINQVVYFRNDFKDEAEALAKQFQRWTDKTFVIKAQPVKATRSGLSLQSILLVNWYEGEIITD